jgi:16S rRNA (cytidine1402-2'-O)-methyltransferase
MAEVFGGREAAVAKELTKLHESVARGTPSELAATLETPTELKGEFVVLVGPPAADEAEVGDDVIVARLKQALQQESFRDAVRSVAEDFKVKRSRVYDLGLALERKDRGAP